MKKILTFISILTIIASANAQQTPEFYKYSAQSLTTGEDISMKTYEGKVVIVVNTASKCGFTPQYTGLEALYQKYKSKGLVILGFPCNQFANQEPGNSEEIAKFCSTKYNVTFPMFRKVDVNGDNAHPLYKYLKEAMPGTLDITLVKWNFTKFIIDRKGNPVKRFGPSTKPEEMEQTIEDLLK